MEKLRKLVEKAGLTQTDLAKKIGTHQSRVSAMLAGEAEPTPAQARELLKLFKGRLTYDDLYGRAA